MSSLARKPVEATEERLELDGDPFLAALDRAPLVQTLTSEQRAELDQLMADIREGRAELVRHEDRAAWFEAHRHELGERFEE